MSRVCFLGVLVWALSGIAGCVSQGPLLFPSPIPGQDVLLLQKAEVFQSLLEERHLSPEGLLVYRRTRPAGATGPWLDLASPGQDYGRLADGGIWTGCYLASQALRYASTLDPAVLEQVRTAVQALELLHDVTGIPGLYGRTFDPRSDSLAEGEADDDWTPARGGLSAYRYRGDVSKDQISGIVFGLFTAHEVVDDPGVRDSCRRQLASLADHVLANGFCIVDVDGAPTTYGDLESTMFGVLPRGVDALISLAIFKAAHHVTGDPRHRAAYEELVSQGAIRHAVFSKVELLGRTKHSNDVMAFLSLYALLGLETEPGRRSELVKGVHRSLLWVGREKNALFNAIVCARVAVDPVLVEDAVSTLVEFPLSERADRVDLRSRKDIRRSFLRRCHGDPCAVDVIPMDLRHLTSFVWKSCPYALERPVPVDDETVYSRCDFLLAYWLLRHHGLIPPPSGTPR